MKFYLCYPYVLFKKREQQKSYTPLPAWLTDNSLYNLKRILMRINLVLFFIAIAMFKVTASVKAQTINLKFENAPIEKVFSAIEKQTSYIFWYDKALLKTATKVNLQITNGNIKDALDQCFKEQPLEYQIVENTIVVKPKEKPIKKAGLDFFKSINITGKVQDENGQPLPGAAIKVKGTLLTATSNNEGNFTIVNAPENAVLIVSYIGFETKEITASSTMTISLSRSTSKLDEVQVMAYGTTTQRLNTGSIAKVTSEEISRQPVSNPLAALQGRVAGLNVVQSGGLAGSSFTVELRGQNSLATAGGSTQLALTSTPLFIIDGIPFAPNNENINTQASMVSIGNTAAGLSPFGSINPDDIESIEVLKDADATAIYGSRGGNGVILITTKKGKSGKTSFTANISHGISTVTKVPELMNTQQYLEMRREAFKNDNLTPTNSTAPDLLVWDQNRYTNFPELFIGGTANTSDFTGSLNAGNNNTRFLFNSAYHKESYVLPTEKGSDRFSSLLNLNHTSENKVFSANISVNFSINRNNYPTNDLLTRMTLEPNYPSFVDDAGNFQWVYNGISLDNPIARMNVVDQSNTKNLISSLGLQYKVLKGLNLRANLGYNTMDVDEHVENPIGTLSQITATSTSSARFGSNKYSGWSVEPQLEYTGKISNGKLNVLVGGTWQYNSNEQSSIFGTGYTNAAFLNSPGAAAALEVTDSSYEYKYEAIFGRFTYNWEDKYLFNLTGRRDGSSRFGPDKQFSNFGAAGLAWIFTNENFASKIPLLSFGKLRSSYGITGTDQIANYQYLDSWTTTTLPYQGTTGLYPSRLANADYSWEENRKLEFGLELGFLKDRFLLTTSYYRNTSDNHLINYAMPSQTGFTSITRNFPAVILNKGWEFTLVSKNIITKHFNWSTSGNISFAKNKLKSFPNIELTSYNSTYKIGESLDYIRGYGYEGVNSETGNFIFTDVDKNGSINSSDIQNLGNFNPKYAGGISNSFSYKNWQIDLFLEFKKQKGRNYLTSVYTTSISPGFKRNVPVELLDRWQKQGDVTEFKAYSTTNAGLAQFSTYNDFTISDASYLRLKNVALNYNLPQTLISKFHLSNCRIYAQGQNIFTVTGFKVTDPETQLLNVLPPLRTIVFGIQLSL